MTCANCVATVERNLKRLDGVGSAVVNQIAEHGKSPGLEARVGEFVRSLAEAVKSI